MRVKGEKFSLIFSAVPPISECFYSTILSKKHRSHVLYNTLYNSLRMGNYPDPLKSSCSARSASAQFPYRKTRTPGGPVQSG